MEEYNKSMEELSNDFENIQLIELVKQANMLPGVPTWSVGRHNPNNDEQDETSNPFGD